MRLTLAEARANPSRHNILSGGHGSLQRRLKATSKGSQTAVMNAELKQSYEFGPFRLHPENRIFLRGSQPIPLTPKVFDTLLLLVERNGRLVPKNELMTTIWPDSFVEESNLTQTIFMLRKALGETASDQRYIVTVAGRGYRFAGPVKRVPGNAQSAPELTAVSPQPEVLPATAATISSRQWPVLVGIAVILVAAAGAYFQWLHAHALPQRFGGRVMLAVLPFENLTGDPGEDYFSDGLTEEMIAQLGRIDPDHVGVVARTSVMHYKHSPEQSDQIARELGVQYVLEGSVRRDSDKVRITAELIQMKDQTHLWSRQYERELSHLLALQDEISQEIADEIQLTLGRNRKPIVTTPQAALAPKAYEAHDLYLKGQYFWNKRTVEGLQRAIDCFNQAIVKDPNYARAYAGLANSYALMGGYSGAPQAESMLKARAAALRALEIDDNLPEAHAALALIVQNYDWDWQTADKEFRRAIELNPNYATAHHWYAEHLAYRGHFDEAFRESESASQLDPLSLIIAADHAVILYYSRQYDRAIEQFRVVLDMDPGFPRASMITHAYVEKGLFKDALASVENRRRLADDGPWALSQLAYVYGRSGQPAQAQSALMKLEEVNRRQQVDPGPLLWAYLGTGDKDQVLAWLEKAYSQHSNVLTTLRVEPGYDILRSDPRFQELMRRVGLIQ
jgi:TolB-like protein/DNA-binding winged helix-turn-helix (wHTH) protein/Tfp pilus assembly protein PilF